MTVVAEDAIFAQQLAIPGLDGYRADRLALMFSGSVDLDRTNEDDLELVNGLKLGSTVEFKVQATVTKKGFTLSVGKEDSPDQTGYGVGLKVHSLEVA